MADLLFPALSSASMVQRTNGVTYTWSKHAMGNSTPVLLMSVVEVGERKSRMASKYFGSGSIVDSEILKPAKSTHLLANWNFSGFSMTPAWPKSDNRSMVCHQCCSRLESWCIMSSTQRSLRSKLERMASSRRLYPSPDDRNPSGAHV